MEEFDQELAYERARGSAAIVCWILIAAGMAVALMSLGAWVAHRESFDIGVGAGILSSHEI